MTITPISSSRNRLRAALDDGPGRLRRRGSPSPEEGQRLVGLGPAAEQELAAGHGGVGHQPEPA